MTPADMSKLVKISAAVKKRFNKNDSKGNREVSNNSSGVYLKMKD